MLFDAARLAAWIHGAAGDEAVGRYGECSLTSRDLLDMFVYTNKTSPLDVSRIILLRSASTVCYVRTSMLAIGMTPSVSASHTRVLFDGRIVWPPVNEPKAGRRRVLSVVTKQRHVSRSSLWPLMVIFG